MAYLVNLTARAGRDLGLLFIQINAEDSDAAWKWYRGLKKAILSLEEQPNRHKQAFLTSRSLKRPLAQTERNR